MSTIPIKAMGKIQFSMETSESNVLLSSVASGVRDLSENIDIAQCCIKVCFKGE